MKIFKLACISILIMIITGCSYKPSYDPVPDRSALQAGSEEVSGAAETKETAPDTGESKAEKTAPYAGREKKPSKATTNSTVAETTAATTEPVETTAEVFYLSEPREETPGWEELPASEAHAEPIWEEPATWTQTAEETRGEETQIKEIIQVETTKPAVRETKSTETTHVHEWIPVTEMIHHDAVTEEVLIIDETAWDETVEKQVPTLEDLFIRVASCRMCGAAFESEDLDEAVSACHRHIIDAHDNACGYGLEGSYHQTIQTGTETVVEVIHHDEVSHYETVVIQPAWEEETVTCYICSGCGEKKN